MNISMLVRRTLSRMTPQQASNLNVLQNFMDSPIPKSRLDMNLWQQDGFSANDCGTRACALGWACTIPQLQAQGLRMRKARTHYGDSVSTPCIAEATGALDSARKLFGLKEEESLYLFQQNGPASGRTWDDPAEVAEAIRSVMRRHGYEPTVIREAEFVRFMERATAADSVL